MHLLANEGRVPWTQREISAGWDSGSFTAHPPRVLIADDQADVCEALRLLLKMEGYETELVNGPAALLQSLERRDFDLVLLDLNYTRDTTSGREGLDLLTRIRSLDQHLPIVVMTAWSNVDLAVEAMRRGACDFVQKPWDNQQVLASVRHHVERHHARRREQSYLSAELSDAIETQRRFLPQHIPQPPGCDIAVAYLPARFVGGDYFDVVEGTTETAICVADVSGKGLPAALLMANLQATLKPQMQRATSPAETCRNLNLHVRHSGKFISLFHAQFEANGRRLVYCNAGHLPPLLVRADGSCERLLSEGAVLGAFEGWNYEEREVCLEPGNRLVLYTDGIVEASDASGQDFGEERLKELAVENRQQSAEELKQTILSAVMRHCGSQLQDDATLLVIAVR
ncbi:MAG TPA: SpoIIE family protein phosphatase [Terriglobales bacterium]|nr:SpoIIE family protein phosphatase [Terriglobales bacterium]